MSFETVFLEMVKQGLREVMAEQQPKREAAEGPLTMSVKEAAEYAGVSQPTMYNWVHMASCDFCVPVGRKKVILRQKLVEFLEKMAEGKAECL